MRWRLFWTLTALAVVLASAAHAAPSPFGVGTPDSPGGAGFGGPLAPVFAWIAAHQAAFYRGITQSLSSAKANGTAPWLLLLLSFAYGIFHAAGPGHGKAVITSYLLASGETAKRGVAISFASAFVQAVVAVAVVAVAAIIFRVTAQTMTQATNWLEIGSYALIVAVGAWLLWNRLSGRGHHHHHHFEPALATASSAPLPGGHGHHHHDDHHHHAHHHEDGGQACDGHAYAHPHTPASADKRSGFLNALAAILAVGIRPCSGAIIILVFALSQGLFMAGVAATFVMALGTGITVAALALLAVSAKGLAVKLAGSGSGAAHRLGHGIEILGAAAVLLFGLLLLGGSLSAALPG